MPLNGRLDLVYEATLLRKARHIQLPLNTLTMYPLPPAVHAQDSFHAGRPARWQPDAAGMKLQSVAQRSSCYAQILPLQNLQCKNGADGQHHYVQNDGRLVLLDFGQCKALPASRHKALAQLIVAMDEGNELSIALAMSKMGMNFSALGGGVPDPKLIQTIAFIVFDVRCASSISELHKPFSIDLKLLNHSSQD